MADQMPRRRRLLRAAVQATALAVAFSAAAVAAAVSSAASPTSQSSTTRLAWFYKPPLDSTSVKRLAGAADELILTGGRDVAYRKQLRRAGYRGRVMQYIDLPFARGGTDPADASFWPWDNQVAWNTGDFARLIHPNESWFLHGPDGTRCREQTDSNGLKYLMNPRAAGWRDFVVKRIRWAYARWSYDGVFFDNVWSSPNAFGRLKRICRGVPREIGTDAEWRSATAHLLARVRALGRPVWANTDGQKFYAAHLDGWMFEAFASAWAGTYQPAREIRELWAQVERDAAAGKQTLLVAQGRRKDAARMKFALAAYLLVSGANVSFRYSSVEGNAYQSLWNYDNYGQGLGAPTGGRKRVSASRWRRDFSGGYVEIDLASHSAVIQPSIGSRASSRAKRDAATGKRNGGTNR
jgi:Hypothetical glycosyl hydrolase family 15